MNRIHSHRPVKQRRALLESNPPRDSWIDRRRNKTVSTFGEGKPSPEETFISEPEYALQNSSKSVSKSSNDFRDRQQQQNTLRKNTLSSWPFFRSKPTVHLAGGRPKFRHLNLKPLYGCAGFWRASESLNSAKKVRGDTTWQLMSGWLRRKASRASLMVVGLTQTVRKK